MSLSAHPVSVSKDDVNFFNEEGYFVYHHQLLPQESFHGLKVYFEGMLADLPENSRPEGMDVPHFAFPELFEWLMADEVLDFVERFMGPDIVLWSSHFLCKPPGKGLTVPWHEDSSYWKGMLDPQEVMTVWLAIDDVSQENGGMRVIPRSHSNGFSEYSEVDASKNVFGTEVRSDQFDESTAVNFAISQGECHVHHAKLIHGSNANTSDRRRCGYTMRYMPASAKFHQDKEPSQQIYLARGENVAGNTLGDPTQPFEPGASRWRGGN
jgi:hypothetical protein